MSTRGKKKSVFVIIYAAKVIWLHDLRFRPGENYGIRSLDLKDTLY